jgi:hypothetical protein
MDTLEEDKKKRKKLWICLVQLIFFFFDESDLFGKVFDKCFLFGVLKN